MATVSIRQLLMGMFLVSFVCFVISAVTDSGNFSASASSRHKAYAAFQVMTMLVIAALLILEGLQMFVTTIRNNPMINLIIMVFMALSGLLSIIAAAVYSASHYPYGWTVAGCTLIMEALFIFVLNQFLGTPAEAN